MRQALKKILNGLYRRLILYNNPFYFYGIPSADYTIEKGAVKFKKLDITVNRADRECMVKGYPFALKIAESRGGKFSVGNDGILLKLEDMKFKINSAEELFIIFEVFVTEIYRFCCVRDSVFIDIGMNSGIATLFYARDPRVKKIYAYELFKPTFLLGKQNLKLNGKYTGKVSAFNFGLSNKAYTATIDYSLSRKGRMGLKGLPADEHFSDVSREEVVVKNISEVFEEIVSQSDHLDIIMKMDCEGEEYNLIESLAQSGLLAKITVVIIEWHDVRPAEIENHLKAAGFNVFTQVLPDLLTGMIYASQRQKSS